MAHSFATHTILEKAAVDNGFSLSEGTVDGWLIWKAHAAPARLCLTVTESGYGVGSDHVGAMRDLDTQSATLSTAPPGFRAVQVANSGMLSAAAGVVWRLARSLPDEPLRQYRKRLREPPSATEVERLRRERIGQDVFREALMVFWDGACAVTGVRHPRLLRASHMSRPLGGLRNRCRAFERPQWPPSRRPPGCGFRCASDFFWRGWADPVRPDTVPRRHRRIRLDVRDASAPDRSGNRGSVGASP